MNNTKQTNDCYMNITHDSIYFLNPFFRLRNEDDHILVFGAQGVGTWRVHRSFGVILSLCNGKRTAYEIARLTQKFVKDKTESDEERLALALVQVKKILFTMSKTRAEQAGEKCRNIDTAF
jgi:hypothetical protein